MAAESVEATPKEGPSNVKRIDGSIAELFVDAEMPMKVMLQCSVNGDSQPGEQQFVVSRPDDGSGRLAIQIMEPMLSLIKSHKLRTCTLDKATNAALPVLTFVLVAKAGNPAPPLQSPVARFATAPAPAPATVPAEPQLPLPLMLRCYIDGVLQPYEQRVCLRSQGQDTALWLKDPMLSLMRGRRTLSSSFAPAQGSAGSLPEMTVELGDYFTRHRPPPTSQSPPSKRAHPVTGSGDYTALRSSDGSGIRDADDGQRGRKRGAGDAAASAAGASPTKKARRQSHRQQLPSGAGKGAQRSKASSSKQRPTTATRSPFWGVSVHKKRWRTHIWDRGARAMVTLGYFETKEAAAHAYDRASIVFNGTEAKSNFPMSDYQKELPKLKAMAREDVVAYVRSVSSTSSDSSNSSDDSDDDGPASPAAPPVRPAGSTAPVAQAPPAHTRELASARGERGGSGQAHGARRGSAATRQPPPSAPLQEQQLILLAAPPPPFPLQSLQQQQDYQQQLQEQQLLLLAAPPPSSLPPHQPVVTIQAPPPQQQAQQQVPLALMPPPPHQPLVIQATPPHQQQQAQRQLPLALMPPPPHQPLMAQAPQQQQAEQQQLPLALMPPPPHQPQGQQQLQVVALQTQAAGPPRNYGTMSAALAYLFELKVAFDEGALPRHVYQ
ncbi:hypothetical protein FOA52_000326 [Chlamydomonas sp. UWO 241]|nr:hypothetical protein FOA52_000326 [Chlamydomonas sp. UWO 241]